MHSVVVAPPTFDDDLGFLQCVEDFAVEQFIAKLRVEALAISILPGTARHDVGGLGSDRRDPFATALTTNSGPLSERTCRTPRCWGQFARLLPRTKRSLATLPDLREPRISKGSLLTTVNKWHHDEHRNNVPFPQLLLSVECTGLTNCILFWCHN